MSANAATRTEFRNDAVVMIIVAAVAAMGFSAVREHIAGIARKVKESSDLYVLPPPEQVVTLSLGYRAALADYLWSHVMVSQGLHNQERRRFNNLIPLIDTINVLEPQFREPYLFADSLITFQTNETPHEEVLAARRIMELGVKNRPLDGELWLVLGQFVGFIAPSSYLTDPAEKQRWRMEGAEYLAQAAELGGNESWIAWQAMGAAKVLGRSGRREDEIEFYLNILNTTDDEELREAARRKLGQLEQLAGQQDAIVRRRRGEAFGVLRRSDSHLISRTMFSLLGPPRDPAWCAGEAHETDAECAATWREWAARFESNPK